MKKRLWILFSVVVLIVVAHALLQRSCRPIEVSVNQVTDTIYVKDSSRRHPKKRKIELNAADSVALVKIYGIGPVFANRILQYRKALGGFVDVEQLREVKGITDEVYQNISQNFIVDLANIQKINVNFATRKELLSHPYISPSMAKRIEQSRMEGGFFNNVTEILNRDILLPKEAQKVTPYFSFKQN